MRVDPPAEGARGAPPAVERETGRGEARRLDHRRLQRDSTDSLGLRTARIEPRVADAAQTGFVRVQRRGAAGVQALAHPHPPRRLIDHQAYPVRTRHTGREPNVDQPFPGALPRRDIGRHPRIGQ